MASLVTAFLAALAFVFNYFFFSLYLFIYLFKRRVSKKKFDPLAEFSRLAGKLKDKVMNPNKGKKWIMYQISNRIPFHCDHIKKKELFPMSSCLLFRSLSGSYLIALLL